MPSSDLPVRGFVPPQNDAERVCMRHAADLARIALSRGIPRYSGFLSDREQVLVRAATHKAGCETWRFDGGWPGAERAVLCIEPEGTVPAPPVACVRLACHLVPGAAVPQHKDYLGSLMGLEIKREALGDILLPPETPGTAYVFALPAAAALICRELTQIGHTGVRAETVPPDEIPAFSQAERRIQTATVSSLRLDAVLAAMLRCSRGQAAALISAGRVEIGHVPATSPHAPVYCQDIFTVRGKGRFQLTDLPGKSKKDRCIIAYFQY